ncbi:uncharacterized protein LOC103510707 [Diaphorina citri]|uniref:Uncharacterized protein LOC103510707 n=1 Tax=Diaphorina citri TaxID=121845 RepID=A0A1S4EDL7_DIACI|nr:uncharacterized protein LOC103510707 [Diaphorina citri]
MFYENNGSTDMENVMEIQYESRTSNSGENISNSGQTLSDQDFDDVPIKIVKYPILLRMLKILKEAQEKDFLSRHLRHLHELHFKSQKVDSKNNANQNKKFTENYSESSSKELCDSAKLPTKDEDATLEKSQMTLSTSSIINLNPIDFELNKKTREFVNPKFSGSPSSDLPEVEEKIFEDDQDFVVIDSWSDSENESIETNNEESSVSFRQDKDLTKKIDHPQWEIRDRTLTKLTPSPTMLGDTETFKCPLSKIAQGRQEKRSPFSCKRTLGLDELSSGLRPPTEADYLSSWKLQCPEKWVGKDSTIRETMNQILDDTIGTVDSNKDMGSIELPGFSEIVSKPPAREESFSSETENPSKIPIFDIEISGQLQKDVTSICQDKMEMTVEKVKECLPCPELKSPSDETYEVNDGGEQKDLSKYSEENSVTMLCENNGSTDMENVMESQYESRTSNSGENISNSGQTLSDQDFDDVPSENTMEASNCELTERLNTLHLNEPQVNLSPKVSHDILTESLPTHINNNGLDVESDEQVAIVEYTETCVEEEGDIVDRPLEISMATCIHGTQEYITRKTEGSEEDEMLTGSSFFSLNMQCRSTPRKFSYWQIPKI